MSELNEVVTWLVYATAAVMMFAAAASAVLFGLALRLVAEFLRELGDDRVRDGAGRIDGEPETPAREKG